MTEPDNDELRDAVGVPSFGGGVGWEGFALDDSEVCFVTEDRESNWFWDSERIRRSSVSSLIVKRSSSSHSGCCPPLSRQLRSIRPSLEPSLSSMSFHP